MKSIEWLIDQLRQLAYNDKHHLGMGDIRITQGMLDDFYEQAKEIHKPEISDEELQKMINVTYLSMYNSISKEYQNGYRHGLEYYHNTLKRKNK
jgi:hypothetical protein